MAIQARGLALLELCDEYVPIEGMRSVTILHGYRRAENWYAWSLRGSTHEQESRTDLEVSTVVADDSTQDRGVEKGAVEKGGVGSLGHLSTMLAATPTAAASGGRPSCACSDTFRVADEIRSSERVRR